MKGFLREFRTFAVRGNAIDLAVGVVIGGAFTAIINSLVNNIILPPFGSILGGVKFSELTLSLGGSAVLSYGLFIQAVVNFIAIAFGLFLIVKLINRLAEVIPRTPKDAPPAKKSAELIVLEEIRDRLAQESSRS